ncbi:MAG: glycosyltransferase family 39 protein [Prevotellaceae bacterium]|jgi:uncharacterized membrane protein|nr:glycosyltransferase family 39 protein [Prevotellaceae bacterium]
MKRYKIKSFEFDIYTIVLFLLTLAAFVLRIIHVDYLTLWVDEYVHVDRARFFPEQPLFTSDNNGILLTMFIIPLFKLFGANEFWARFPSVIFGTLLVPAVYLFAKHFFNKNRNIALISAALVAFSTYLTFWSRISRNYAIFVFFFLLFLYFLGRALNMDDSFKEGKNRLLNYLKLQPKYLWFALGLLVLSILSHQLAFLFIYGLMFYYALLFLNDLFRKKYNFISIEAIIAYLFVLFSIILFIPAVQGIFRSFFLLFLPQNVANWVLPNLDRLSELWKTEPYNTLKIYNDVLKTDYASLYGLGWIGFICTWIRYRKQGFYITAMFAVLFLAMSFVFREPSLPRYLIYIYPLFLMAIACSFDTVVHLIRKIKIKINSLLAVIVSIVIIGCLPTTKATVQIVTEKKHGQVVPHELSNWFFPDWKMSLKKVQLQVKPDDAIISTMSSYPGFYLKRTDIIQFRQRFYNSTAHQYENFPPDTTTPNAKSLEALQKLFNETERIWLFADYYFTNVMTDPRCRDYIVRNCEFKYDLSNEYVKVFFRDSNTPPAYQNQIVELLTRNSPGTMEYSMMLPNPANRKVQMIIEAQGIFFDNELGAVINGQIFGVPITSQVHEQAGHQIFLVDIPRGIPLREGENKFQFFCNTNSSRKNLKIAVYNFSLR